MNALNALNNDGLSPISIAFVEGKLLRAINHHKKTAATIKFFDMSDISKRKASRFGRSRNASNRHIVQHALLEMFAVEEEQRREDEECDNAYEDRELAIFDSYLNGNGGYIDEERDFDRDDRDYRYYGASHDDSCPDCGCRRCMCEDVRDDFDAGDWDDWGSHYSFSRHSDSINQNDGSNGFGKEFSTPAPLTLYDILVAQMNNNQLTAEEEEAMNKLSDKLWKSHEAEFGINNLLTMSKMPRFDDVSDDAFIEADFGALEFDGFEEFGAFTLEAVDEFGGLPNHFDPKFHYRTHFWMGTMYDWDYSVDLEDIDLTLRLTPEMARRCSRFDRLPSGKPKRFDRYGRTHNYKWLSQSGSDGEIERAHEKTAEKRALRALLDETFGVDAPKARKTRFKSMEEKEQYEARQSAETKRNGKKSRRGDDKNQFTAGGAASSDNVDYSLPARRSFRMCVRKVHVERWANVDGVRTCISSGIEKMLVRR